ncbi:PAS domain-containing sensor histidine kinase [Desulfohalovibrio reitneri]|uniref:PAS domain-containing sensor histidine kinase n=1 Tax=Desulfohalovibrio reitneri TaxID=1307759 RepID=UPI0005566F1A|nr:PAS domain-containing sensor histidine kinase [Desulfohalovibrio reitneri]
MTTTPETAFLPPERLGEAEIQRQARVVGETELRLILDSLPNIIFILNAYRQIVFANKAFEKALGPEGVRKLLGSRPGEVLGCPRSKETPGGCGTAEACRHCGAAQAIMEGLSGRECTRECRLTRSEGDDMEAMDLLVTTKPLEVADEIYTLFHVQDISGEKRRRALERVFFHDILNSASGIRGLIQMLREDAPPNLGEDARLLSDYFEQMVEEILAQKDLLAAEQRELQINPHDVDPGTLLSGVARIYNRSDLAAGKELLVENGCPDPIRTDSVLLKRVVENMIKNALEAEYEGATVTASCDVTDEGRVRFEVRNPTAIPEDDQLLIFQRSFSTKGGGRGLGTYGMKLLGEKYLGGRVFFTSTEEDGTRFAIDLPRRMEESHV